jgi:hypothetical protein
MLWFAEHYTPGGLRISPQVFSLGCINDILKNIGQYETVLPVKSDQRIDCVVKCERYQSEGGILDRSAHYIGKMCASEYPYGRGERKLVINTKESAYTVDGKLVHSIDFSIFLYDHGVRTKALLPITEVCESHYYSQKTDS